MRLYVRAISYFRQDLGKVLLSLLMTAAGQAAGVVWPLPLAILIDVVLTRRQIDYFPYTWFTRHAPADRITQVILLAGAMLGLRLFAESLQMLRTMLNIRLGYNGLIRVRCDLFRKLQALSLAYHRNQPQGDAIYRLSSDTNGFQGLLNIVTGMIVNVVTLGMMTCIMFSMNWKLTVVSLGVVPPLILTIRFYARRFNVLYTRSYEMESKITTAIQRSIASIGLVQAFGREADEYENFASTQGSSIRFKMRLHWDEVIYWLILGVIFAAGAALILGYGGYLAVKFPDVFAAGMLSTFLIYVEKLYEPLKALSSSGSSLIGSASQVQRVFDVLDQDPVIKDAPDAIHVPRKPRALAFENVGFEYRPGVPVLQDINVRIAPGQMVAFVGSSGVGKTTLLSLLPRFYDPTCGAMKLDDLDARKIRIADLRKHVALVLQDNVILPTTIAENIAYGRPGASNAQIHRAAELAGAAGFIEQLPQKYETQISEAGSNLSGGQKQRISIARALVTEAPILVLDEPTSALDPQHEQMIVQTLRSLKGQRTIILVSHRLSTVADCDQIFVMDQGRIVEQGAHQELIARRGLYFNMARHQLKLDDAQPRMAQIPDGS